MVDITIDDDVVVFKPRGWSKLWAFRCQVAIRRSAVRGVRRAAEGVGHGWWKGWRVPGTHLPGVIIAGRYYRDGGWEFWDVRGTGDRAIEVELTDAAFRRLVIDVANPDAEVARLQAIATANAA